MLHYFLNKVNQWTDYSIRDGREDGLMKFSNAWYCSYDGVHYVLSTRILISVLTGVNSWLCCWIFSNHGGCDRTVCPLRVSKSQLCSLQSCFNWTNSREVATTSSSSCRHISPQKLRNGFRWHFCQSTLVVLERIYFAWYRWYTCLHPVLQETQINFLKDGFF